MSQVIKLKSKSTESAVPLVSDLIAGELAINTFDGKIFLKKNDGVESIVVIGADAVTLNGETASYYLDYGNFTNTPTIDTIPTDGSTNAVQSDGVFDALATKEDSLGFTPEDVSNKGLADGYAPLGADTKIPTSYLPALAITDTSVVADETEMLALTAETGDVAIRSDENKTYILAGTDPSVLGDWQEMLTPTDVVISVNGQTGAITLTTSDITEGTNLYYTDARVLTAVGGSINDSGTDSTDLWSASKIDTFVTSAISDGSAHSATTNPSATDDINAGYYVGQTWINTTDDIAFILVDGTVDTAIWIELSSSEGTITNGVNVGSGAGIFKDIDDSSLTFKTLTNTDGRISFTGNTNDVEIGVTINDLGLTDQDLWSADQITTRLIDGGTY